MLTGTIRGFPNELPALVVKTSPFKLALVQMRVRPGEAEANIARALELAGEAAEGGAQLILLPEAMPFGWTHPSASAAQPIPGGTFFEQFRACARQHHVHLCTGLVERAGDAVYNSAILLGPSGELLLHHRKIHELCIAHGNYALGDRLGVVDTPLGRIGLMICADGFAPGQVISRTLALMGAQIILSPSAWAVPPDHDQASEPYGRLWLDNYGAVAREYPVWIAGCSNVGPVVSGAWSGHKCIGRSMVIAPGGTLHAQAGYGENAEEILAVTITPAAVKRCGPE